MPYTAKDDDNLAKYIAVTVPNFERGGRSGNSLYVEMCAQSPMVSETIKTFVCLNSFDRSTHGFNAIPGKAGAIVTRLTKVRLMRESRNTPQNIVVHMGRKTRPSSRITETASW